MSVRERGNESDGGGHRESPPKFTFTIVEMKMKKFVMLWK